MRNRTIVYIVALVFGGLAGVASVSAVRTVNGMADAAVFIVSAGALLVAMTLWSRRERQDRRDMRNQPRWVIWVLGGTGPLLAPFVGSSHPLRLVILAWIAAFSLLIVFAAWKTIRHPDL